MNELIAKADVLIEALPFIRRFRGSTFVIKYGGHAMQDPALRDSFARDVILLRSVGIQPVIVHGGGPQIDDLLRRLNIQSQFVQGQRVTGPETMDVVEMVLSGLVNGDIVRRINRNGGRAVGLSGKDGGLLAARKLNLKAQDPRAAEVDLDRVGDVESVNIEPVNALLKNDFSVVIAPVGVGRDGLSYNINADTAAGAIASAFKAEKLILMTDTAGVLDTSKQLIPSLTVPTALRLIHEGVIAGGMIPKVHCCIDAVGVGVKKTHIIDGRLPHAVLLEIFTDRGIGTELVAAGGTP